MWDSFFKTDSSVKSQTQIIEEIHNEFDTAPERLVQEANRILSQIDKVSEHQRSKADRLKALGFTRSNEVSSVEEREKATKEQIELANLVDHYRKSYPFMKFLTYTELDRICGKYGLIYAPVGQYIREVPEKSLKEIENAQPLLVDDLEKTPFSVRLRRIELRTFRDNFPESIERALRVIKDNGAVEFEGKTENDLYNYYSKYGLYYSRSRNSSNISIYDGEGGNTLLMNTRTEFFIAAPKDHFDLQGFQLDGKFEYKQTPIVKDDPIVFRKVRGGILVITKWGLEASDPALLSPVNN